MDSVSTLIIDSTSEVLSKLGDCQLPIGTDYRVFPNIDDAIDTLNGINWHPQLIIVWQTWSDQFSKTQIQRLIATLPLARLVCFYGPWCESDGRNRDLWPLPVRVPQLCFAEKVRFELEVIQGERLPIPLTASRDEYFEADSVEIDAVHGNALLETAEIP